MPEHRFDITSVQAIAMFETSIGSDAAAKVFKKIPEAWDAEFDGGTEFFPLGGDFPPDLPIPLFRRTSSNKQQFLNLTKQRIEFIFNMVDQQPVDLAQVMQEAARIIGGIADILPSTVVINRLATVVHRISKDKFTAKMLAEQFCSEKANEGPYKRLGTFELHAHKVFTTQFGEEINSWVRQRSARRRDDQLEVITIEQDMNTLVPRGPFAPQELRGFFEKISSEAERCFETYYPQGA